MRQVTDAELVKFSKIAKEVYDEIFKPKSEDKFNEYMLKLKKSHEKLLSRFNRRLAR